MGDGLAHESQYLTSRSGLKLAFGHVGALVRQQNQIPLRFHYVGDWSDIPSGWPDSLLTMGYDILVTESYDWWAVYLSLPHDPNLMERLPRYECDSDGNGFSVRAVGERMILYFGMQLDYGAAYDAFGEDPFEGLADLFERVRDELLAGDLSAVWAMYGTGPTAGTGTPSRSPWNRCPPAPGRC